ncbi:MAG TPA: nucleotidyltransferase domain-containing protein [Thermoanaerobaculia bacterium]|nr:nucleotidyltransferase domain-containing protein [Thermoanaerobaculia bacterium]
MLRDELVDALKRYFAAAPDGLVAVYLFGSRARGEGGAVRDVDLGLLFGDPPLPAHGGPADRIADALGLRLGLAVDAVVLDAAPSDLVHRVLRDGILVHEGDAARRVRFEVSTRRAYLDLLPVLRQYRAARAAR